MCSEADREVVANVIALGVSPVTCVCSSFYGESFVVCGVNTGAACRIVLNSQRVCSFIAGCCFSSLCAQVVVWCGRAVFCV
jgi:hypothetical protein